MKKFISGIIVGVLLFTGASAFADSVSLIGQKVQGLFTVEKSGAKIADAVIINGTAYAPVRAVSEATGATLIVEGKKIILGTEQEAVNKVSSSNLDSLKNQKDLLLYEISKRESGIKGTEQETIPFHEQMAKELANNGSLGKQHQDAVDRYKKEVEQMKNELVELKQQLADLDVQIAALEK